MLFPFKLLGSLEGDFRSGIHRGALHVRCWTRHLMAVPAEAPKRVSLGGNPPKAPTRTSPLWGSTSILERDVPPDYSCGAADVGRVCKHPKGIPVSGLHVDFEEGTRIYF